MRVGSQGSESEGGGSRLPQNSVWWSVVVANVCQFSGGPSHGSPVSQVSAPLLRLRSSCRPFVGTLLPSLSCSFSLPGVSNTCFHTFSFFCDFDSILLCCRMEQEIFMVQPCAQLLTRSFLLGWAT